MLFADCWILHFVLCCDAFGEPENWWALCGTNQQQYETVCSSYWWGKARTSADWGCDWTWTYNWIKHRLRNICLEFISSAPSFFNVALFWIPVANSCVKLQKINIGIVALRYACQSEKCTPHVLNVLDMFFCFVSLFFKCNGLLNLDKLKQPKH